jgi:hypothetical protein
MLAPGHTCLQLVRPFPQEMIPQSNGLHWSPQSSENYGFIPFLEQGNAGTGKEERKRGETWEGFQTREISHPTTPGGLVTARHGDVWQSSVATLDPKWKPASPKTSEGAGAAGSLLRGLAGFHGAMIC